MRYLLILFLAIKLIEQCVESLGIYPCPKPNWLFYKQRNRCYAAFEVRLRWKVATSYCRGLNASLIKIHDEHIMDFINNNGMIDNNREYWTGLFRFQSQSIKFQWLDEPDKTKSTLEASSYQPWGPKWGHTEVCGIVENRDDKYMFSAVNCRNLNGPMCEMRDADHCIYRKDWERCAVLCVIDGYHQSHCECNPGYRIVYDTQCEDINECKENDPCDHVCTNTIGGFHCRCNVGYRQEGTKCLSNRMNVGLYSFILPILLWIVCYTAVRFVKTKTTKESSAENEKEPNAGEEQINQPPEMAKKELVVRFESFSGIQDSEVDLS